MKQSLWLALIVLALGVSACARAPRSPQGSDRPAPFTTQTIDSLPGSLFLIPATEQPPTDLPPAQPPTIASLPTLVPTISLPTATVVPLEPSPTVTLPPATPLLDPACLAGTWQVIDLQQAMAGSMAESGSSLTLEQVNGQARYIFNADGSMALTYQQLAAVLSGTVENRTVQVVQSLDGTATARYTVDAAARMIEMSAFGGEGIRTALEINGQTLAEGSLPVWLAFTHGQGQQTQPTAVQVSRAAASCEGGTLSLQAVEPVPGPVLQLKRVQE